MHSRTIPQVFSVQTLMNKLATLPPNAIVVMFQDIESLMCPVSLVESLPKSLILVDRYDQELCVADADDSDDSDDSDNTADNILAEGVPVVCFTSTRNSANQDEWMQALSQAQIL